MERPMQKLNDLSRSLTALEPDGTLIAVIEMSLSSWLVAGIVPGVERQPLKKLAVDESALLKLLYRWREEAEKAGRRIERIVVAFEAGRDGFWLARWPRFLPFGKTMPFFGNILPILRSYDEWNAELIRRGRAEATPRRRLN